MLARRAWTPGIINEALPGAWLFSQVTFFDQDTGTVGITRKFFDLDCKFPGSPNRDLMRMKLRIALIIIVPTPKSSCFSKCTAEQLLDADGDPRRSCALWKRDEEA